MVESFADLAAWREKQTGTSDRSGRPQRSRETATGLKITPSQPLKVTIALSPTHFVASLIVSFVDKVPDNAHDKE